MAKFFHWINKAVEWYPKMHPRYRLQGPAAFLAPSNPDELADVGTLSSPFYRGEVREAILTAKTPLELTGTAVSREYENVPPKISVLAQKSHFL